MGKGYEAVLSVYEEAAPKALSRLGIQGIRIREGHLLTYDVEKNDA